MNNNIERRSLTEFRSEGGDGNTVSGYAIIFDSPSVDMGFTETISRSAITQEQIDNSDIFALLDHSFEKVLARSKKGKGSLVLDIDERGVRFEFSLPNSVWGNELREHINRGEIDGCSFGFICHKDRWEERDGSYYRTIEDLTIVEISAVFLPAYPDTSIDTSIASRSLNSFKKLEEYKKNLVEKLY